MPVSGNRLAMLRPPRSNTRNTSPGGNDFPGRQGIQDRQHAACLHRGIGYRWILDRGGGAVAGIGLTEQVILERQNAVVVGRTAPQHRRGAHQAALCCLDQVEVAGAAGPFCDAIVGRIDKAHVFRAFAVEQRIGFLWIGARRIVPVVGIQWQHVGDRGRRHRPGHPGSRRGRFDFAGDRHRGSRRRRD